MYSNKYITIYTIVVTLIVSVLLSVIFTGLKPIHDANEEVFIKKDILGAISNQLDKDPAKMSNKEILDLFKDRIEQVVIDHEGKVIEGELAEKINLAKEEKKPEDQRHYPLFIYNGEGGKVYLTSIRGNGLWDKIWAYVALKDDFNTIVGASFGHIGETPGLGAEIKDNPAFRAQFVGKTLFENGEYVSVAVVKGGVKVPAHEVDAISGATITSTGVSNMFKEGMKAYIPYFESLKHQEADPAPTM